MCAVRHLTDEMIREGYVCIHRLGDQRRLSTLGSYREELGVSSFPFLSADGTVPDPNGRRAHRRKLRRAARARRRVRQIKRN